MLKKGELDFNTAKVGCWSGYSWQAKIGHNEELNNAEEFKERILSGPVYHKCLIFVDNSGADVIFGIIPFARYLLAKGTRIVLAANSNPSVNDITVIIAFILTTGGGIENFGSKGC